MLNPFPQPLRNPIHAIQVPDGPRLAVTDLEMAGQDHPDYDAVISLVDPGTGLDWYHPRHHVFEVSDWEVPGPTAPDAAFVAALLELDLQGADRILIHCHAGYSRSPAAAMLWARKLGARLRDIEAGIDWSNADPNRRILALGEAYLGSGGALRALAERRAGRQEPG